MSAKHRRTSPLNSSSTPNSRHGQHVASTPKPNTSSPISSNITNLLNELQLNDTNDGETQQPKRSRNITLTPAQFSILLGLHSNIAPQSDSSPTSTTATISSPSALPAYYSNAKYEEISCKAIKPLYNGSEENLIPFLTKLELHRQHEGWASATFVTVAGKKYDLTTHFALLTEADMQAATTDLWSSPDVEKENTLLAI
jgi:hypothetical protein